MRRPRASSGQASSPRRPRVVSRAGQAPSLAHLQHHARVLKSPEMAERILLDTFAGALEALPGLKAGEPFSSSLVKLNARKIMDCIEPRDGLRGPPGAGDEQAGPTNRHPYGRRLLSRSERRAPCRYESHAERRDGGPRYRRRSWGRYPGWLALHAGVASGAEVIRLPENPFNPEKLAEKCVERSRFGERCTIVAAGEGAMLVAGDRFVERLDPSSPDPIRPGGVARFVADAVEKETEIEAGAIVLGYVQRAAHRHPMTDCSRPSLASTHSNCSWPAAPASSS